MEKDYEVIAGSIDTHVHFGPDTTFPRRYDGLETASVAEQAGMKAIVLKSHSFPTAALAQLISKSVEKIAVFGGVCLDTEAGGLNPELVHVNAVLGARVIWMPTFTARYCMQKRGVIDLEKGITLLDDYGKIKPEVIEILEVAKEFDLIIGSGHISYEETYQLYKEARARGLEKLVVTHPCTVRVGCTLTLEQQQELARMGCYMEHCFVSTMPLHDRLDPEVLYKSIKIVGPERCIMASDFGQAHNPPPPEGLRMFVMAMLKLGLTEKEIDLMLRKNPANLLGIE